MANERSTRPASTSSSAVANMQAPSRETGESVSAVRSPAQGVERRSHPGQRRNSQRAEASPQRGSGLVGKRCALQVPLAARREAGGGEERPQRRAAGLGPVDARHQERLAAALVDQRRERLAEGAGGTRSLRLLGRQEGEELV